MIVSCLFDVKLRHVSVTDNNKLVIFNTEICRKQLTVLRPTTLFMTTAVFYSYVSTKTVHVKLYDVAKNRGKRLLYELFYSWQSKCK